MTKEQVYQNYVEFVIRNARKKYFDGNTELWWGNVQISDQDRMDWNYYIKFDFNHHLYHVLPWERVFGAEDIIIREIIKRST